tara:strand:+ start:510 stop:1835 length:1326 start_codon:yes stop_codon:yes gene_type:complete
MEYVELYSKDILDIVSIGKGQRQFNEKFGDYIKVEILGVGGAPNLGTLYSNRLLLQIPGKDKPYLGDYHYHTDNPKMGFCTGKYHSKNSITNLQPISISSIGDGSEVQKYKKQIAVFRDSEKRLYIKPNDLIKLFDAPKGKYKVRIHFLRNQKSPLGSFLDTQKENLIENGNFFAGLEATQAGDMDRSVGKNNFRMIGNPGFSPYALEQSGLPNNEYTMRITGIKPNMSYVFSCWVAWDDGYNGDNHIVSFDTVSSESDSDLKHGLIQMANTDARGSFINDEDSRILSTKQIGGLTWYRVYSFIQTDASADLGYIHAHLGKNMEGFNPSMNPLGKRYFTDLRFEGVQSLFGTPITEYLDKLKSEIDLSSVLKYHDIKHIPGDSNIPITDSLENYAADPIPPAVTDIIDTIDGISNNTNLVDNAIFEDTPSLKKGGRIKRRK